MTNLKILIKNNINCFIGLIQNKRKKSFAYAITFISLVTLAIIGLYSFQVSVIFNSIEPGLELLCIFQGFIITFTTMFVMSILRMSTESKSNDTELLLSLPIKKVDIIISKILSRYIIDLLFSLALIGPYIVIYQIRLGFDFKITLCSLFLVLLLPLMSVGMSYIFNFIVARLFSKSKHKKALQSIFSLIIFIFIFALLLFSSLNLTSATQTNLEVFFNKRPISYLMLKFVIFQDLLGAIFVLAITILPFILGVILFSFNYGKTFVSYSAKSKNLHFSKGTSSFGSLLKKEIGKYTTSPIYITNTIISPIMVLGLGILIAVIGINKIEASFGMPFSKNLIISILSVAICACLALATITACSISLEGKQLWILKSTPVNENILFMAKSTLSFIMLVPLTIISSIIIAITVRISFVNLLILLIIPLLYITIVTFGGLFINLCIPKLEWNNETEVVKQSLSVLVAMTFNILVASIPVGIYFIFRNLLNIEFIALISGIIYIIISTIVAILLFTVGKNKFRKLN